MIRRLFIAAVSLAALTACTTYNSGYRNYQPAQAGYGDYYYAPDPGPSYYSPGYVNYPAYYSLYWGFDRHYYSAWRQPHFHYGVTWFPNDWFGFSVVHRYPRYGYWHPYAPYRYSAWDHRFAWRQHGYNPRHRDRAGPRYGHPSNERHMQRERLVDRGGRGVAPNAGVPRARSALEAAAPQGLGNARQRAAYGPQSTAPGSRRGAPQPTAAPEARMRQQALQARESRLRDEGARMRDARIPAQPRQSAQRPWQQTQSTGRARAMLPQDAASPRSIPNRRESQGPRQVMGAARGAATPAMGGARAQDPRMGNAPRARAVRPEPVQQRRVPARQTAPARQEMRQAPRSAMPQTVAPQPRMPRAAPPSATPAPMRQAPMRQAAPPRAAPAPAPMRQAAPRARQAPPPRSAPAQSRGRASVTVDRDL